MRKFGIHALLLGGLIAAGISVPASANVVYDLTFDNYGSTVEGTGTLTLNFSLLSQTYNLNESLAGILVNITTSNIDGNGSFTITPSNLASGSQLQTGNVGQIYTLTAGETEPSGDGNGTADTLFLDLYTNTWQIHGIYDSTVDQGDLLVAGPALVSATPLPATLPLFAGGLGFVGYLMGRKKRKAGQALTAA